MIGLFNELFGLLFVLFLLLIDDLLSLFVGLCKFRLVFRPEFVEQFGELISYVLWKLAKVFRVLLPTSNYVVEKEEEIAELLKGRAWNRPKLTSRNNPFALLASSRWNTPQRYARAQLQDEYDGFEEHSRRQNSWLCPARSWSTGRESKRTLNQIGSHARLP